MILVFCQGHVYCDIVIATRLRRHEIKISLCTLVSKEGNFSGKNEMKGLGESSQAQST